MSESMKMIPLTAAILMTSTLFIANSAHAQIEEIIVTAQKRSENINDVGLAISAVTGEDMKERKLTSLEEISSVVPGLVYASSTANTPIFTLRGVGFNEQSLGAYPATSLYLDEAPMPFPVLASHAAYDLERVEVLKGPQGILFGQNSTGGAINFIPAKPTEDFEAAADISYGRFNERELNGYVSGPLTDNLGARFALTSKQADDWQTSNSSNRENGETDYTAGRLILDFTPTDTTTLMLNINGWQDKSDPQAQQFIAANTQVKDDPFAAGGIPPSTNAILAQPFSPEDARAADWSETITPESNREFYQVIMRGDFDISDTKTLTLIGTHMEFDQKQVTDGDGSPLVLFDLEKSNGSIESSVFEARLAHTGDTINWVVGANLEKSLTSEDQNLRYVDSTNNTPKNGNINSSGIFLEQDIENYAVFANIDVALDDRTTLKVGSRYTDSSIESNSCNYATGDGNVAAFFNMLGTSFNPGVTFSPVGVGPGECYTLNYNNLPGEAYTPELAEDNVSWRVGMDYDLSESTLLYFNISKGYKTGSFPSLAAATWTQLEPVVQETVLSYEVGSKATLTENLHINSAIFYYQYEDKQVRGKVNAFPFGILDTLVNVPESTIMGAETDITYYLTEELSFTASLTYLDSEVDKYEGINALGDTQDFSGESIPFTPKLSYSLGANYEKSVSDGGLFFVGVNVVGQSKSDAVFAAEDLAYADTLEYSKSIESKFYVIDPYYTVDARVGYESADGHWKVMLWGKNITDEYYYTNLISSSDSVARFAGRPATYGLTLGYTF